MSLPIALRPALFLVLAIALNLRSAAAQSALPSAEVDRADVGVREGVAWADRLRSANRPDLAKLVDDLVAARRAGVDALRKAVDSERDAATAEEAHAEALKGLDRTSSAREERRQRLARLADQLAQAEKELEAPVVVSMPRKGGRALAATSAAVDAPQSRKRSPADAKGSKP